MLSMMKWGVFLALMIDGLPVAAKYKAFDETCAAAPPVGAYEAITTEAECREAATSLGLTFNALVNTNDRPPACHSTTSESSVSFNSNLGSMGTEQSDKLICKALEISADTGSPKTFFAGPEEKSFSDSEAYCKDHGGTIATVVSAEEDQAALNACRADGSNRQCWIGLEFTNQLPGGWALPDGTEASYTNWDGGQGGAASEEQHAFYFSGSTRWHDVHPTAGGVFPLCQKGSTDSDSGAHSNSMDVAFILAKRTYSEAEAYCAALGGELASYSEEMTDYEQKWARNSEPVYVRQGADMANAIVDGNTASGVSLDRKLYFGCVGIKDANPSCHSHDENMCSSFGDDCCAHDDWGEVQTCEAGYYPVGTEQHCMYECRSACGTELPGDDSVAPADESNDLDFFALLLGGLGGGGGDMGALIGIAMACGSNPRPSCTGDCGWSDDENKCDISPMKAMELMSSSGGEGGGLNMGALIGIAMECGSNPRSSCTGDCGWSDDENKCDISPMKAMELMSSGGGEGGGIDMGALIGIAMACGSNPRPSCTGDCGWSDEENKCDISPMKAMELMSSGGGEGGGLNMGALIGIAIACGSNPRSSCTGDCGWSDDENKCDISPMKAIELMSNGGGELATNEGPPTCHCWEEHMETCTTRPYEDLRWGTDVGFMLTAAKADSCIQDSLTCWYESRAADCKADLANSGLPDADLRRLANGDGKSAAERAAEVAVEAAKAAKETACVNPDSQLCAAAEAALALAEETLDEIDSATSTAVSLATLVVAVATALL